MVVQFQTAFMPKKAPVIAGAVSGFRARSISLFGIISLIIFFLTAGLAAGVFFYKSHLIRSIRGMDTALAAAKKSFEPEFIDEAARLSARIASARQLLDSHRSVSPLFDTLEKKTLEHVRFRDFNFTASGEKILLAMTGEAKSFNAVALQSDVFGADRSFGNPVFTNFNLNESGDVIFNFTAAVDAEFLRYRETVLGGSSADNTDDGTDSGFEEEE